MTCVSNADDPGTHVWPLTVGKEYEVLAEYEQTESGVRFTEVVNDRGRIAGYSSFRFQKVRISQKPVIEVMY